MAQTGSTFEPLHLLVFPVVALSLACSSSYRPVHSARIATTLDGGAMTLVKGNEEYSVGIIGSEVVDAVRGNPAAEEHARAFRNNMITGWTFYGLGLGVTFAGAGVFGAGIADSDGGNEVVGLGLTAAGLGLVLAGVGFIMNGQPHLFDAINIYNDGVDASLQRSWPGRSSPGPGAGQPLWLSPPSPPAPAPTPPPANMPEAGSVTPAAAPAPATTDPGLTGASESAP